MKNVKVFWTGLLL